MTLAAISPVIAGMSNAVATASPTIAEGISGFGSLVEGLSGKAVESLRHADTQTLSALSGEASTREVVEAVMDAEQSLQIAISIRDKIVSAYLEISRMAI